MAHNSANKVVIDSKIFEKIAGGDDMAFEELYRLTYRPLYAFLLSLTLNHDDTDDLLQDTYIRIRGAAHLYKDTGNPMAWIMTIAKNLFLMKLRKEKKEAIEYVDEYAVTGHLSFDMISNVDNRIMIEQLFRHIDTEDRNIIIMHVIIGLKHKEIANILNQPVATVLTKYHRAMKKLKKYAENEKEGA